MTEHHQPTVAATLSRAFGSRLVLYTTPAMVWNTAAADFLAGHEEQDHDHEGIGEPAITGSGDENTLLLGLGGRLRLRPSVFLTGEFTPRLAGYDPGATTWGVALEKKTGGHTLQINFTNSFGTTFGQLARLGSEHDVYLGFNVTRLF
jgi:hypothetical protein